MRALTWQGKRNVAVEDVPDPRIQEPTDAIIEVTSTGICGSDLHMYEGRTDFEQGRIVEEGTHAELIRQGGLYADLWRRQSGGFLGDRAEAPVT